MCGPVRIRNETSVQEQYAWPVPASGQVLKINWAKKSSEQSVPGALALAQHLPFHILKHRMPHLILFVIIDDVIHPYQGSNYNPSSVGGL